MDDVLREGDFDAIDQTVTPKTLARCKTNTLIKSFQVGLVTLCLPILPVYFTQGCFARRSEKNVILIHCGFVSVLDLARHTHTTLSND